MFPYRRKRIGIFGGSFNPPHKAHSELAKYALKNLKLDLLIFLPSYRSVEKLNLNYISSEERLKLLLLVLPKGWVVISEYELKQEKALESVISLRYFKNRFNKEELFFLLGADHCPTLHKWEGIEELLSLCTLTIFRRMNTKHNLNSISFLPKELLKSVIFLKNKLFPHSSTLFRESQNYSLLHKKVRRYLQSKSRE